MMIDQYAKEAKQSLNVFKDSITRKKLHELVDTVQLSAHRIVTLGVGLFEPNMRVGTIAEICPIRVHFQ